MGNVNAFASGINKKSYTVTLTTGIINYLNDQELEGVIAHELTHIWQYTHWDNNATLRKCPDNKRLLIYEGMAKWAEIQYLIHLNEISYAKRQEIITRLRDDEYGKGFRKYAAKYSLAYNQAKNSSKEPEKFGTGCAEV